MSNNLVESDFILLVVFIIGFILSLAWGIISDDQENESNDPNGSLYIRIANENMLVYKTVVSSSIGKVSLRTYNNDSVMEGCSDVYFGVSVFKGKP